MPLLQISCQINTSDHKPQDLKLLICNFQNDNSVMFAFDDIITLYIKQIIQQKTTN